MNQEFEVVDQVEEEDERLSSSFLSSLNDFMEVKEVEDLNIDTQDESFRINTKEQAGFFIRKVQEVRNQAANINETADKEIERLSRRINEWRQKELNKCGSAENYLTTMLQDFALNELSGSDKKSIKLPFGTLGFKKQQDKYEYDDAILLAHLQLNEMNDYIQLKPSPKKAELKKIGQVIDGELHVNGTAIPGITVTAQDEKFEVK